jgi:hypothetical protein
MSSYTKSTDFASKDALLTGNPLKVVKGTEIDDELNAIQTAINSKADSNSPALTGTPTTPTAAASTDTTQVASTAFVQDAILQTGIIGTTQLADDAVTTAKIADDVALGGNPTTTTQEVADDSTRIATTAFVRDAINEYVDTGTFNDGVSGYLILPNGMKMAWGRTASLSFSGGAYSQGSRAESLESLPVSFSAVYHAQATTLTSSNIYAGVESLTTSQIRVWARCHQDVGSYSAYIYWMVIGE